MSFAFEMQPQRANDIPPYVRPLYGSYQFPSTPGLFAIRQSAVGRKTVQYHLEMAKDLAAAVAIQRERLRRVDGHETLAVESWEHRSIEVQQWLLESAIPREWATIDPPGDRSATAAEPPLQG